MNKVYLDSCIFVAYFHDKHKLHKEVCDCIEIMKGLDLEIFASNWSINEMIKVLVKDCHYNRKQAEEIAKKILKESKLDEININWIKIDSDSKYTFDKFFEHLTNHLLDIKEAHISDAIHSLIMINNNIDYMLTTDLEFKSLKNITILSPKAIKIFTPKNKLK